MSVAISRRIAAPLMVIGLLSCIPACSDPYAQEENAQHLRQIDWTVDSAVQREERSYENLDTSVELFEGMGVFQGDMEKAMYTGMRLIH